MLIKLIVMKIV